MIERVKEFDQVSTGIVMDKFNELIDASNRQDRALVLLLKECAPGPLMKFLPDDFKYWHSLGVEQG